MRRSIFSRYFFKLWAVILLVFLISPSSLLADERIEIVSVESEPQKSFSPELLVAQKEIDLGRLPLLAVQHIQIPIQNVGTEPLIITDIRTSCGCTVVSAKRITLEPGEKGTVEVVWNIEGEPGLNEERIFFQSNDHKNPEQQIEIFSVLYPEIEVSPKKIALGNVVKSFDTSKLVTELKIYRVSDKARQAEIRVDSTSKYLTIERTDPEAWASDVYEVKLADHLPEGTYAEEIVVRTDIAKLEELQIPVRFRIVPDIRLNPDVLFLGFAGAGETIQREIEVVGEEASKPILTSAHSENGEVSVDLTRAEGANKYMLKLTFGDGFLTKSNRGVILLKTDNQTLEQVRLPFFVHARTN